MQIRCPEISQQLITYLEAIFPDRAVNPQQENAGVVYGNAEVVRHLIAVRIQQEEASS